MTYGAIGALLPAPAGLRPDAFRRIRARWVGYALARAPDDVPWQRVVNSAGRISPRISGGLEFQRALLRHEGVRTNAEGGLDLDRFRWSPSATWIARHTGSRISAPSQRRQGGG
jgi:alkylated DNA nucleotide flippase Atl1